MYKVNYERLDLPISRALTLMNPEQICLQVRYLATFFPTHVLREVRPNSKTVTPNHKFNNQTAKCSASAKVNGSNLPTMYLNYRRKSRAKLGAIYFDNHSLTLSRINTQYGRE